MSFYGLTLLQFLLLLAAGLSWLTWMYLLRKPPQEIPVSSILLWERALERRKKRPPDYLRRLVSWLIFAAVLGAGLFALADPEFESLIAGRRHLQIVLDNHPGMLATDAIGVSRWQRARDQLTSLLEHEKAGSRVLLQATGSSFAGTSFSNPREALEELEQMKIAFGSVRRFPDLRTEADEVIFLTDGTPELSVPVQVKVISFSTPVTNLAFEAFQVLPGRQASLTVGNQTRDVQDVEISVRDSVQASLVQHIQLEPGERKGIEMDLTGLAEGPVQAVLGGSDDFALDNARFEWLPPVRHRVVLAGDRNLPIETALSTYGELELHFAGKEPGSELDAADALILVNWAPAQRPNVPTLVLGAPSVSWLPEVEGSFAALEDLHWDLDHPLMAGIRLADLRVGRAGKVPAGTNQVLGWAPQGALVLASREEPFYLQLTFRPEDSNLPGLPAFPILLDNFLTRAFEKGLVHVSLGELKLDPDSRVWDPEGSELAVSRGLDGDRVRLERPGIYSAITSSGRLQIVANAPAIRLPESDELSPPARLPVAVSSVTWWRLLLALAAFLLLAEWSLFHRRMTV